MSADPPEPPPAMPDEKQSEPGLTPSIAAEPLHEQFEELQGHNIFDAREAETFGQQIQEMQHQRRSRALSEAENMALIASLRRQVEEKKRTEPPKAIEKMSRLAALRERTPAPHPYDALGERHRSFLLNAGIEPELWNQLQQISGDKTLQRRAIRTNEDRAQLINHMHIVVQESKRRRKKAKETATPKPARATAPRPQPRKSKPNFLGYAN